MQRRVPNICMWIWQMINDDKNVSHNNPYVQKMEFWKYMTYWRTVKEQFELIVSSRLYLFIENKYLWFSIILCSINMPFEFEPVFFKLSSIFLKCTVMLKVHGINQLSLHIKLATEMTFCELNYSKPQLRCKLCVSIIEKKL